MTTPATPSAVVPAIPGALSNKHGSNTSTDALSLTFRYSNPASQGDAANAMRVIASRIASNGVQQAPVIVWDPGWIGAVTTQLLPTALDSFGFAVWKDRVYVTGGQTYLGATQNTVWSAPFNGGNVGAWRAESPLPVFCCGHTTLAIDGFLYVIAGLQTSNSLYRSAATVASGCWKASIDGNGQVGGWSSTLPLPAARCYGAAANVGAVGDAARADFGRPVIVYVGGSNLNGGGVAQASTYATTINADGTFEGWVSGTNLSTAVFGHFLFWEPRADPRASALWCLGGSDGTIAKGIAQIASWDVVALTMGVWAVDASSALPAIRCGMSGFFTPYWDGIGQGRVVLWGGTNTSSLPTINGLYTSLIYSATPGGPGHLAWTSFTPTDLGPSGVPTGLVGVCCGGCGGIVEAGPSGDGISIGIAQIAFFGGHANGGDTTLVYSTSSIAGNPANGWSYFYWGWSQSVLNVTNLGTGAAITLNQGGTVGTEDITFLYGAYGLGTASALADGDEIQFSVQFVDNIGGDPSPIAYTTVRIGQAPILSGVTPSGSISTGNPTASFTYTAGTGGGPQAYWRVTVRAPGSVLVFDSGQRPDLANSVALTCAPYLLSGTTYTRTLTVASTDTPVSGSSASATSTATFTPSYTPPAQPT